MADEGCASQQRSGEVVAAAGDVADFNDIQLEEEEGAVNEEGEGDDELVKALSCASCAHPLVLVKNIIADAANVLKSDVCTATS